MPSAPDDVKPLYVKLIKGRWYWDPPAKLRRSHGVKTVSLGGDQVTAWAHARNLNRDHLKLGPNASVPGSVGWLFDQFLAGEKYLGLADSTQKDYRWLAKSVLGEVAIGTHRLAHMPAMAIKPRHADAIYATLKADRGHSTAHYACRFARRVWHWGYRREFVAESNPWSDMELRGIPQRTERWSRDQVAAVRAKAVEMGRSSIGLAVLVAYCFGHRQADVLGLTWSALDAGEVATSKTAAAVPVDAAAYPVLEVELLAERARQAAADVASTHVIVCEMTMRPWQVDVFRHEFRKVAKAAGIPPELQFRDLRATAMTELSDAGADVIHMATHSGHKTTQMARRYARPTADQFRAAAKARTEQVGTKDCKPGRKRVNSKPAEDKKS